MIDLKLFRKNNKFTQEEAGAYFGCTQAFISQIELKKRPIPDFFISKIEADNAIIKPSKLHDQSSGQGLTEQYPEVNLELEKAYWEIESLQKRIEKLKADYTKIIEELKGENRELIRENGSLEYQVSTLNRELDNLRSQKAN